MVHTDCMAYMATLPDKAFDLAIVDPPYGSGKSGGGMGQSGSREIRREIRPLRNPVNHAFGGRFAKYSPPPRAEGQPDGRKLEQEISDSDGRPP